MPTRSERLRLFDANRPLVAHICMRLLRGRYNPDLDVVGQMALWKCTATYDPDGGAKFSTYAYPRIRGAMLHEIRDHYRTIRIPAYKLQEDPTARIPVISLDEHTDLAATLGVAGPDVNV